jgi:hypothetical protein
MIAVSLKVNSMKVYKYFIGDDFIITHCFDHDVLSYTVISNFGYQKWYIQFLRSIDN